MAMTETIDTNNYEVMAKAMGISADANTKSAQSNLARLRISHSPIMGDTEVKGKKVKMEVVLYLVQSPQKVVVVEMDKANKPQLV